MNFPSRLDVYDKDCLTTLSIFTWFGLWTLPSIWARSKRSQGATGQGHFVVFWLLSTHLSLPSNFLKFSGAGERIILFHFVGLVGWLFPSPEETSSSLSGLDMATVLAPWPSKCPWFLSISKCGLPISLSIPQVPWNFPTKFSSAYLTEVVSILIACHQETWQNKGIKTV